MPTTDTASSGFLKAVRWPAIAFSAVFGLTPHILLLNHTASQRLTMIIVMHAAIVPTLTAFFLRALERRARTLEAANVELRRTAEDLARKNRQHDALSSAVRLLAAGPSVSAVVKPLADLSREALRANRLRLSWAAPDTAPVEVVVEKPGAGKTGSGSERVFPVREGSADLGEIAVSTEDWDSYDETTLSILISELRLRWRLRHVEANALSALDAVDEGLPGVEGPRQTHRLLEVMCDAAQADGASLYLRRAGKWELRADYGETHPVRSEEFQGPVGLWALDDGATVCIKGTQDGVLVLQRSDAGKIDTAALDPPLVQMIAGHSATLTRVVDGYQQILWSERRRVARELHDDVCQSIASVHMQLGHLESLITEGRSSAAERCHQLREAALDAYEATRLAVDGFRQKPDPNETAAAFLERFAKTTCERYGVTLEFRAGEVALDPEATWQLGRVLQEAVGNAARHGRARTIDVSLETVGGRRVLKILDDGTFRDPALKDTGANAHHGLKIMAERVEDLHGQFSISHGKAGTEVRVDLPAL
ncbi:sensor histidine kinase [Acidimangrovimonas pyrenivorans]|uniref:Sensor histidine kinase n=1 Tax=Acidimangrovimonas pyrenivorans TaxID=2030798 RepID=A0ABV7AFD2_9RHOB